MERRGATRYRLRLIVTFSWKDDTGAVQGSTGRSRDLNGRGIYVHSESVPSIGAYVEMNVFLPQRGTPKRPAELHAEGRVVRIEPGAQASQMGGFAAMNHTVILRDSQGHVLDEEKSWTEFGFGGPEGSAARHDVRNLGVPPGNQKQRTGPARI